MRIRRWALAFAALFLAAVAAGSAWYLGWHYVFPPTYSCSLPETDRCEHTARHADWWNLTGRPLSIDVRPAPPEWADSLDLHFQSAEWAAKVERFAEQPVLAACAYSSGEAVTCKATEEPFDPFGSP